MNVCLVCGRLYDDEVTHCTLDAEELLPHEPSLEPGSTVAERYQVVRAVGLGQTGEIFEGREGDGGERVVLKLLAEDLTRDRRTADSLRRHLLKARDFRHPVAVPIRAVEQHENRLLLVRNWVEGERLQDVLARDPAWPVNRAVEFVEQICAMLAAAHKVALLHLQIRPSNLFLLPPVDGGDERVAVVDFGIGPLRRVGNREVYGTLRTLAPEQIEGKIPTFKSDIYSTGLLLHRLIVGSSAFSGTEEEVARKVANDAPPPLIAPSGEEIPAVLDNLVRQMVEKRAIARPPSVAVVLEKLQALRGSIPPSSPSAMPGAEAARPTRRERATVVMQTVASRGGAAAPTPAPAPAAYWEPDTGVRRDRDTARRAALGQRRSGPPATAATAKPDQLAPAEVKADQIAPPEVKADQSAPAEAKPDQSAPAEVKAEPTDQPAVPAPRPDVSPEEGSTQEIQPEIIEDRPKRPPPRIRPRPGAAAGDTKPATSGEADGQPPAAPGFGSLPAADGEPPAEQTIDVDLADGNAPRPGPFWQKLTPRQRIYAGAAAGAVLLLVVLALALSGGADQPSPGADADLTVAAADATTEGEAATTVAEPIDAGAATTDAVEAVADTATEQVATDVVETAEPADAAVDESTGDTGPEATTDAPTDATTDATAEVGAGGEDAASEPSEGTSASALVAAGNRALNSRQLTRARTLFRQALGLEPANRQARTGLGRVAFQQGQFAEAVRYLEPLYRNQGHMDLGVAYVRVGRRDDARRQFEKLLTRNPNNTDARRALDALNR